ncbi:MAG TPA: Fur family transcriptional regulator [Bacillota bacterium]|nr:Fur family transcriptional regulator [Bacillota bacterium]
MKDLDNLQLQLRNKGYKLTGARKSLLRLFVGLPERSYSVQEVFHKLDGQEMDFSTVYRNLEMLAREGILTKMHLDNGKTGYELCHHHHHHHFVCMQCGATRCIDFCPMDFVEHTAWEGFTPKGHRFEIIGVCPECAKN